MLVAIFGAGASYDSDPGFPPGGQASSDESSRPPLARELFAQRFGHHLRSLPAAVGLIPQLRKAGDAIEQELERIRDDAPDYDHLPRELAALRCYIRDVVRGCDEKWWERSDGVTNYTALIQAIERWRQDRSEKVCLITFNYDTLLDRACRSILPGFPLDSVESYVSDPRYKLIKLHGSVDWYRRVQSPDFPAGERNPFTVQRDRELLSIVPEKAIEYLIDNAQRWSYVDDFRRVQSAVPPAVPPWGFFPAIAIPTATKTDSDFECPRAHLELLAGLLPEMTHLLVIGWRGVEEHFFEVWRNAPSPGGQGSRRPPNLIAWQIVEISEESALAVESRIKKGADISGVPAARRASRGFSSFLEGSELAEFLDGHG